MTIIVTLILTFTNKQITINRSFINRQSKQSLSHKADNKTGEK